MNSNSKDMEDNIPEPCMSESKDIKFTRDYVNKEKMCLVNGDCLNVYISATVIETKMTSTSDSNRFMLF